MSKGRSPARPAYLDPLDQIINHVVAPRAAEIDRTAAFPREAIDSLGRTGILGLISSREVGGLGESHRAAAMVVEKIASACASTAMIVCMHYAGTAVVEAYGPRRVREAIAEGTHLTTLAFSETGSRSHFWAPTGTARRVEGGVKLDAKKSWITSAGHADSYVWSSRPLESDGQITLWLVPAGAERLTIPQPFNGLGLRGNHSSPVTADGVIVSDDAILGADGGGFDIMMATVLPYFQLMNAAFSVGTMDAATSKSAQHVAGTRFEHLGQSLADLPTVRAYLSRMRIQTDMSRALLLDTIDALERGREDAMLRVLEVKAAAGEAATEVTDMAMRVCGGAAFRKEVGVERHFRDARAATVMGPTTDVLYDFIGKALCGIPLFS
ncbi:MAG TPA: acyl-CoA dehydrogenase family protein [Blastocatellia bacterium]|nr:acyl-CoA dehydrogenase family protein [Blastocatellia bacterium]